MLDEGEKERETWEEGGNKKSMGATSSTSRAPHSPE
jgi:hypothetical protein